MPSLLVHRSTFFELSSPACQKRTMKDRSSTPPLHVHVDENTPVHVHIKKLPKASATSSQVGARPRGQAKALEQGDPLPVPPPRASHSRDSTDKRTGFQRAVAWLEGRQDWHPETAAVALVRRGSPAELQADATRGTPRAAVWGRDPGFVPFHRNLISAE